MINGGVQLAGHLIGFLMELISVAILKKSTFALMCFFCVMAIVGAILLVCADTLARTLAVPAEVPVGIFTALLGSSFFLWLLARGKGRAT